MEASIENGAAATVHVRSYVRMVDGRAVQVQAYDRSKPWRQKSNPGFREAVAGAEGSTDRGDAGYARVNESSGALGRYQIMPESLTHKG